MEDDSETVSWLQNLLSLMGYTTSVTIRVVEASPQTVTANAKNYWLDVNADSLKFEQIQRLIGQDGIVIDSLQYIANVFLNRHLLLDATPRENHDFYTVEINGFRSNRLHDLTHLAESAVQNVRETQSEFVIKQLSSTDRRFIHQLLEEFPDIETHSQGREPNRHLVVKLVQV